MAPDDKDRLGKKLTEKERAEEGRFFAERDREALRKLQEKAAATAVPAQGACPRCSQPLRTVKHHGVGVEECPTGHGMWLDQGEIEVIASRERDSWLGRLFYLPKPKV
jgi:DNA repair exonuclease SbcCD ATPase subunit